MRTGTAILVQAAAVFTAVAPLQGQANVASTVHNLSVSGPGEFRSLSETEICKFCHIPHNAVVAAPLWGHALSRAVYVTPALQRGRSAQRPAPQPDGASRLCLSCHDGTVALGDVVGESRPIPLAGRNQLVPGDRGYLGTDLSGSHPVSVVFEETAARPPAEDGDMGLRPLESVRSDREVRLDSEGKVQCTSCHDPHVDRYFDEGSVPRFWTKPTVAEVCNVCHVPF